MIRFKFQEQLISKGFKEGRRLTLDEVALATGIHRTTLTRLGNPRGANFTTDNLDRLCHYFGCPLHDLAEYVPSQPPPPRARPTKGPADSNAVDENEKLS
jgi:putative transcriptional regulator